MSETYRRFQEGAYTYDPNLIYDKIKDITLIDRLIPSKTFPNVEDLQFDIYTKARAREPTYKPDYETPEYIDISSLKETIPVSLLISGIKWNAMMWKRAQKDKISIDERVAALGDEFAPKRDRIGLSGDAQNGLTSLIAQGVDDTDCTSDVSTFVLAMKSVTELLSTMELGIANDGVLGLKNIFEQTPKWLLVTPDVKAIMHTAWASTTNAQMVSAWDKCKEMFNGQCFASKFLGSGDYGVTAGAQHMMVGTYSLRTAMLMQTGIEKVDESYGAKVIWEFQQRFRPYIKETYGFVYTNAVALS